ncbi:MAG: cytochrome P450 [Acidimicrobiia bacterium]
MEYNPYAADTQHNPFPIYRWLRDEAPVYHNEKVGFWALSRYDDVLAASLDTDTFLSGHGITIEGLDEPGTILINTDPPEHTWHRRIVSRVFTAKAVASQEESVRAICRSLLAEVREGVPFDVIEQFSLGLPVAVICEMLGIPPEARDGIHDRSSRMLTMSAVDGPPVLSEDVGVAAIELAVQILDVVNERVASPGDDIITLLLQSEVVDDDGNTWKLTPDQVAARVVELVVAGHETTAKLIGNMVVALAWYPDHRAELAADPSLVANAVEEGLRWDGPSHYQGRWVERDVGLHGGTIPAGSRVVLLTGAACHDDRVFEQPELFDIHRDSQRNLAFGWGIHLCLGRALAWLETRVAIEELLAAAPEYELVDSGVERARSGQVRGHNHLPISTSA